MLKNFVLLGTTLFFLFASVEGLLFSNLNKLPLDYHFYLSRLHRPLAQSFKSNTIPKDYIALVGDSYAQGMGGWLFEEVDRYPQGYHIASILHEDLNRDIVTFGEGGLGSMTGIVNRPYHLIKELQKSLFYRVDDPTQIIVMFYAGNDLNNNLHEAKIYQVPSGSTTEMIEKNMIQNNDFLNEYGEEKILAAFNFSIAIPFIGKMIKLALNSEELPQTPMEEHPKNSQANMVIIGEELKALPSQLQSPALDLTREEKTEAIEILASSLKRLQKAFPDSKIGLLFLPSVLGSYQIGEGAPVSIEVYQKGRKSIYPSENIQAEEDWIALQIHEVCQKLNIPMVDATPLIREKAKDQILHGPHDWKHFNNEGYRYLSQSAKELLLKLQ